MRERLARFRHPDGSFEIEKTDNRWYRITEQRLDDGGCLKIMVDITVLKKMKMNCAVKSSVFEILQKPQRDWFWEVDQKLCLTYLSDRYETLTGDNRSRAIGRLFADSSIIAIENSDARTPLRAGSGLSYRL